MTTDAAGLAVYNDLTITAAGSYKLQVAAASLSALSDSFDITAATSGQTITAVDGSGQSAHVNTAYGGPLRALVAGFVPQSRGGGDGDIYCACDRRERQHSAPLPRP